MLFRWTLHFLRCPCGCTTSAAYCPRPPALGYSRPTLSGGQSTSFHRLVKKVKSSMARSLSVENLLPQNVGQLSTTCSNLLKWQNGEHLVAVDHNQLRTMASETVDQIDWSHPPPSWAVLLERLVHRINWCSLSSTGNRPATSAYEATALPKRPLGVADG